MESADIADLKSAGAIREGSSPFSRTNMPAKLKWHKHAPYKGETDGFESLGRHQYREFVVTVAYLEMVIERLWVRLPSFPTK